MRQRAKHPRANHLALIACIIVAGVGPAHAATRTPPVAESPKIADMSPAELLRACAERYAAAKTYRDEGEVRTEFVLRGQTITDVKPFATAFERDGRFKWEFRHSPAPGRRATDRYTVWSEDQTQFRAQWTLQKGRVETHSDLTMAMAGPTGISGGSATVVVPLLRTDMQLAGRTTRLEHPVRKGREEVDGVVCTVIEGTGWGDSTSTLWIDDTLAIRKVRDVREIDPATLPPPPGERRGQMEKFTTVTVITLRPVFDEPIPDEAFEAPAKEEAPKKK